MRLFSFLLWLAWAVIGLRVLLVAAPALGLLGGLNWLFRHTPWTTR